MDSESIATKAFPKTNPSERAQPWFGHWTGWLLAAWAIVYLACATLRAIKKPLWYDELFTLDLANLPRFGDFWTSLASGTELNPPLHYLVARESMGLVGTSALGLRLPSIVGYLLMIVALYRFVARRVGPAYAWVAATFPLVTYAYNYAFEARPYAMVLGLSGLALLGWQSATENRGRARALSLALMTLSLAAAVSCHYYAVLVFVPIGLGELVRSWTRRKIDLPVWIALVAGLFPLVLLRGFIKNASGSFQDTFWARPSWSFGLQFYLFLFRGTAIPLVIILVFLAIESRTRGAVVGGDDFEGRSDPRERVPLHEVVAGLGFVALPFVGLALAKLAAGGAFTERYALPAVIGFGLLTAYVGDWLGRGRRLPGIVMALSFCGWFLVYEAYHLRREPEPHFVVSAADFRPAEKVDLPLVFSWSIMYLQAQHDLPPDLSRRAHYLIQGKSTDDLALKKLGRWIPLNLAEYDDFVKKHNRFYLCGFPGDSLFHSLLEAGWTLTLLQSRRFREGEVVLVLAERATPTGPPR